MHSFFSWHLEKAAKMFTTVYGGHGELDVIKAKYGMTLNALSYTDLPLHLYVTACKTAAPSAL